MYLLLVPHNYEDIEQRNSTELGRGRASWENMTLCSERRKEADANLKIRNMEHENHVRSTQNSPYSKRTTGLQHQNTRTMWNTVDTVRTYQTEHGRNDYVLGAHHTGCVAFMFLQEAHNALISLEAARLRIRRKKENIKLSSIQCCAQTNAKDENKHNKDFYNKLQT